MDITVYLPDDLGQRAKQAGLKPSRLLREAVEAELQRRDAVATTLGDMQTYELELEDPRTGAGYTGRITGKLIAAGRHADLYLSSDGRVIAYEPDKCRYAVVENPAEDLEGWLAHDPDELIAAMSALGLKPTIDL